MYVYNDGMLVYDDCMYCSMYTHTDMWLVVLLYCLLTCNLNEPKQFIILVLLLSLLAYVIICLFREPYYSSSCSSGY